MDVVKDAGNAPCHRYSMNWGWTVEGLRQLNLPACLRMYCAAGLNEVDVHRGWGSGLAGFETGRLQKAKLPTDNGTIIIPGISTGGSGFQKPGFPGSRNPRSQGTEQDPGIPGSRTPGITRSQARGISRDPTGLRDPGTPGSNPSPRRLWVATYGGSEIQ